MSEWISVKDRLPETDGMYLVSDVFYGRPHIKIAYYMHDLSENLQFKCEEIYGSGFVNGDNEGEWVEPDVTHWMPLPEPPEEVSGDA